MPRKRKPQWVTPGQGRPGRWRTKIDGRWHYAPKEIGKDDQGMAWVWLKETEARELRRSSAGSDPTVYWLCLAYLRWAEGEVDAGRMTREQWKGQRSRLRKFWEWGPVRDTKARHLTVDTVEAFFDALRSGELKVGGKRARLASPSYVAGVGRTIRTAFRWAARPVAGRDPTRLIPSNPLEGYKFPRAPGSTRDYVEGEIVRRFYRWAWAEGRRAPGLSRRFDRLFVLMLWFQRLTGCRPGEACALRWDQWDRAAGKVVLREHKTAKKTLKPRLIWVTPPVLRLLRAVERLPGRHEEYVFTHRRAPGAVERGALSAEAGEPWPSGSAAAAKVRKLRGRAIEAGVKGVEGVGPKKIVAYANRHGYVSVAISSGLTHEQAARLVGNTAQVIGQVYAHAIEQADAKRAEDLSRKGRGG